MTALSERLLTRYYSSEHHPYRGFEGRVDQLLKPTDVLLDAGCGRTAPVLRRYLGRAQRLIGVEMVEFTDVPAGIETYNSDLANLPLGDSSVDVIMSRSVFEHLQDPAAVYTEFARILKPGGRLIFLTANMWDYATLVASVVPNRFHSRIVRYAEGREEADVFPTQYRTNTRQAVERLSAEAALEIEEFKYLGQYPNYFMFNAGLFLLGTAFDKLVSRYESLRIFRGWILVTLRRPIANSVPHVTRGD